MAAAQHLLISTLLSLFQTVQDRPHGSSYLHAAEKADNQLGPRALRREGWARQPSCPAALIQPVLVIYSFIFTIVRQSLTWSLLCKPCCSKILAVLPLPLPPKRWNCRLHHHGCYGAVNPMEGIVCARQVFCLLIHIPGCYHIRSIQIPGFE